MVLRLEAFQLMVLYSTHRDRTNVDLGVWCFGLFVRAVCTRLYVISVTCEANQNGY
jgi:hypothetical protein